MNHSRLYATFVNDIQKICDEKEYNEEIRTMLQKWLDWIFNNYNEDINILDYKPLFRYIVDCVENIKNIRKLDIYKIEEILENKSNPFNRFIFEVSDGDNPKYRLKKEEDHYVIAAEGNFYLVAAGLVNQDYMIMKLLEQEDSYKCFHHELQHIGQGAIKYKYPTIFPFSSLISNMCIEGEADYHRRIIEGDVFNTEISWNEKNIDEISYDLYYQLYMLLMFILPEEMRTSWEKGDFNVSYIPEEKKKNYVNIFAIITFLVYKGQGVYKTSEIFDQSLNLCYQDCCKKINCYVKRFKRQDKHKYEQLLKEVEDLLQNSTLFMEKLTEIKNEKQKKIKDQIKYYKIKINEYRKRNLELMEEKDYQLCQFGINLSEALQNIKNKNISIAQLMQMLIEEVEILFIEKRNSYYFQDKLTFIENLKNNYHNEKNNFY